MVWANSDTKDQMLQNMVSDQGTHCLPPIQHCLVITLWTNNKTDMFKLQDMHDKESSCPNI